MAQNNNQNNKLQKDMELKINDFLSQNSFPAELLPENWKHWKDITMATTTDKLLNMPTDKFISLMSKVDDDYTLAEMSAIFKAIETLSYLDVAMYTLIHKMPMDRDTYMAFLDEVHEAILAYNEIVKPKIDAVNREYAAKTTILTGTPSKGIIHKN